MDKIRTGTLTKRSNETIILIISYIDVEKIQISLWSRLGRRDRRRQ